MHETEAQFHERVERAAAEFCRRYGVVGEWTDVQLDRALADHGYPPLATMPPGPRGMMNPTGRPDPRGSMQQRIWRRTNAAHLLGHKIAGHPVDRCDGCRDW